ncbi:MAG: helix-turn-helix transcriptional regulator [Firmicutes bacterium]|nr:helix-turn-helix transcriptional regulator [Bacillota bacterium]
MQKVFIDDNYYYDIVRRNIKKYRLISGFTQQELADLTNLTRDYICNIESLRKNKGFSLATLGRIAWALEIDIRCLFDEIEK